MRSAVMEPDATGLFVASSFMYATARDWARFGLLYLRDGVWEGERILPEGWVRYSVTPAPAAPLGEYGAQWWLNAGAAKDSTRRPFPNLPREFYRAAGFEGQMVGVVPSADLVVVRLGLSRPDQAFDAGELLSDVLAALGR
jgi:CubicO group peptidase (beta-lactamase class C family)